AGEGWGEGPERPMTTFDIAIVGAGPVGLLLANMLGARGLSVLLIERRTEPPAHSQAIGITPPSLHILAKLGLEQEFVRQGVQVRDCHVHGESGYLGCMTFRNIPDTHRFILSLPQSQTCVLLQQKLAGVPNVTLRSGCEVANLQQQANECDLTFFDGTCAKASYVVACDGSRSPLRELLRFKSTGRGYPVHFVMGDFIERTSLADEAHLFFKAAGSVESFPLPGGLRRWIVQTPQRFDKVPQGLISEIVRQRTGIELPPEDQTNQSVFTPRRLNCTRYHEGRVILCGDAAHVMSPIGGQGMNTGFADAEFLAGALCAIVRENAAPAPLLAAYNKYRRKAAQTAIQRAGLGMWLGTWTGKGRSMLRDLILRTLLGQPALERFMGPYYAMLTIPYNTLDRVPLPALKSQPA
ncbi:MAG: hypothetical protein JWO08_2034, partial [Verrucomicrobiaceae bacterium]|nr:hypothetical protein [Verrucomicrobiaceae bacterium]